MANNETILCDYAGCDKPFAYRIKGFNLCSKHCFEPGEFMEMIESIIEKSEHCQHERLNEDGVCRTCGEDRRGI